MGMYNTFKKYLLSSCATVMCPDKKLTWFNDEGATVAEQLVQQRWSDTYEKLPDADTSPQSNSSPIKVCYLHFGHPHIPETESRCTRSGF